MTVSVPTTPRRPPGPAVPPPTNGGPDGGPPGPDDRAVRYVGTIVGESTSQEFRLAVAHEAVREQDIVAVDAVLRATDRNAEPERLRVWAKVQRIERMNPLFPAESAHELAETRTDPFDTVLSLSREMVTAVCEVLGAERVDDGRAGGADRLDNLRYPAQPASSAYRPASADLDRVIVGDLASDERKHRGLDVAWLANRREVDVKVDGHAVVTRHLAILAMTGAGKSWAARRLIEELARKNYPIIIFDPHGDYVGLDKVSGIGERVDRYYADFPLFEEEAETVGRLVSALGYQLTPTMQGRFDDVFDAAVAFYNVDRAERDERKAWLAQQVGGEGVDRFGLAPDLWLIGRLAMVGQHAVARDLGDVRAQLADYGWDAMRERYTGTDIKTLEGIGKRAFAAAKVMQRMEGTNRKVAGVAKAMPRRRGELVQHGRVSVVSLAGYTGDLQATIYSIVADELFAARVNDDAELPVLLVLEEAHNFVPAKAYTPAEERAIRTTKQIAQEGRKFGVGLVLISQRPSRLDETTLSQCNSYVILRMVNPDDQRFVRRVVESLSEEEARLLPSLDNGEALLSGQFINFPVLVKMKPPESRGQHEEEDAFKALAAAQQRAEERRARGAQAGANGRGTASPGAGGSGAGRPGRGR